MLVYLMPFSITSIVVNAPSNQTGFFALLFLLTIMIAIAIIIKAFCDNT